jgi:hypothetical protein
MTVTTKYTTPGAAGTEVDARARRYVEDHQGVSYQEAVHVVLKADKQLAEYYSRPAARVTMATTDKPAIPVPADVEREIKDWITRALEAGMAGSLPGALGQLSIEADSFRKIGMPIEEVARRAMDLSPSLVAMASLLLRDIRRNVPSEDTLGQAPGNPAGFEVHVRAEKLQQEHPSLNYRMAVQQVLYEDKQLKLQYAGVK